MASYHRPRIGAILLAILFASVTLATILKDVIFDGATANLTHYQSVAAMIAAIASGHLVLPAAKRGRIVSALGLALVFTAATLYIVVAAGARNAEVAGIKTQDIGKRNAEREAARHELDKAEADTRAAKAAVDAAIRAAAAECGTGKGSQCRGKEATREAAKDDLAAAKEAETLARGKVLMLGPDENPHEGYHHAARTLEALGLGTTAITEAQLELLMPFALVLISELATLVFTGIAAAPRHLPAPPAAASAQTSFPATPRDLGSVQDFLASRRGEQPQPPKPGAARRVPQAEREVIVRGFVEAYRAKHGRDPEPREVRQATGLPRASAHRWQRRVETQIAGR